MVLIEGFEEFIEKLTDIVEIFTSFLGIFTSIGEFIVNYILIPVVAVSYVLLFLVAQYFLIRLYIYLGKQFVGLVLRVFTFITQNEKLKSLYKSYKEVIDEDIRSRA